MSAVQLPNGLLAQLVKQGLQAVFKVYMVSQSLSIT